VRFRINGLHFVVADTAEVAGSSPVVPAIHSKRLTGRMAIPSPVQKGATPPSRATVPALSAYFGITCHRRNVVGGFEGQEKFHNGVLRLSLRRSDGLGIGIESEPRR